MGEPVACATCAQCRVWTRSDCLDDISDIVALAGKCCELCASELVSDFHDDGTCDCSYCCRARARADRVRRAAEASVRGGVSMAGLQLVGLDGEDP